MEKILAVALVNLTRWIDSKNETVQFIFASQSKKKFFQIIHFYNFAEVNSHNEYGGLGVELTQYTNQFVGP